MCLCVCVNFECVCVNFECACEFVCEFECVLVCLCESECVSLSVHTQGSGSVVPFALTHKCWDYLGDCFLRMP